MRRFCLFVVLAVPLSAPAGDPVLVDRAWLAHRGGGPYLLDRPGTYRLATDVRTAGTAFVVDAADVTLDLGGHEVVYGDAPPIAVRNGGFEQGSGRDVPGWDVRAAPAAALAANSSYLFGKQVLRLTACTEPQRIVSAPITVPAGEHLHVAAVTPARGDYRTVLRLTVLDARSGKVLGEARSANVERGFSAVATFRPGGAAQVVLRLDVTPGPGKPASLDLDQAVVAASGDYGILASNAWSGEIPGWANLPTMRPLSRQVRRFTLCNGTVRQGAGSGHASPPLFCAGIAGLTVEDVQTRISGMDTNTVFAERASGAVTVRRCTFRHAVENISDRGKSIATLRLLQVGGPITVEECRFISVPQVGILLDGASSGQPVRIRHNRIHQDAVVTNGYALIIAGSRNFEISHNHIVADNGRGIDIDSYRQEPVEDGVIHHNHVEVRERHNREYWSRVEARALRLRNTVDRRGVHRRLRIHDNTFVATTGPGLGKKAFAVRITYQNRDGCMKAADVRIERNTLRAVALTADPSYRASALALDGFEPGIDLHLRDNVLESNDAAITLADTEGPAAGATLIGNTLLRLRPGAERPFAAVHAGYWNFPVRQVALIDSRLRQGATLDVRWGGPAVKEVGTGQLLTVRAGSGATVVVKDRSGAEVYRGTADASGVCRDIAVVTRRHRQATADWRKGSVEECGPFEVIVRRDGHAARRVVPLRDNATLDLTGEE